MAKTDESLFSANLRTVKELILDEQKLVTYISLSKHLCIHVNDSKTLLGHVVDEIKRKNNDIRLSISFIISGLSGNNSGRTTVCPESDLETQRDTFKTIFFEHVYSVSKGSSCVDNATLASVNTFDDFLLCAGLIKGKICTKRSYDEIGSLKSNSQKFIDEQKMAVPLKKVIKEHNAIKDNIVLNVHETKSEPVMKSNIPSPKKDTSSSSNGKTRVKNGIKASKDIAGFFTKSNSAPSSKTIKDAVEKPDSKIETQIKTEIKQEIKNECMEVDEEIPVRKIKKEHESTKKTNIKKTRSINEIKKNAKVDKKRKRVLHVSDSESDDEDPFADEKPPNLESDDEIPPTPSTNTIKITSGILNPKKRRKLVDKTYTDDEGYILTRKEEIYESCSEEEVETLKSEHVKVKTQKENVEKPNKVSPKEKKAKDSRKKVSPPQKGKQATLTSFFKKV